MVMKILLAVLSLAVLILIGSVRKQRVLFKEIMHFMYINSSAYKELADAVTVVDDLAEFRSHFADMKEFMRKQLKSVGAPVDDWDKECQ